MTLKTLSMQYGGHQHGHHVQHVVMAANGPDFAAICDRIALQLNTAKLNQGEIPRELYEATAGELMNAVFQGTGGRKTFTYEDPNNLLVAHLRHNVHNFSAAKSLTEMQVFNDLMVDENGKVKSKERYRADVAKAGYQFNMHHLEAERSTALTSTQAAITWNQFQDDDIIEVRASGAENVCPQCGLLNGFTRPKSDKVWLKLCIPFHFYCNCSLIPGLARNIAKNPNGYQLLEDAKIQSYFRQNPGVTMMAFDDGHGYYKAIPKNKPLRWDKTYNMRSLEKIYRDKLPPTLPDMTRDQANTWWKDQAGTLRADFYKKDLFGTVIQYPKNQRQHIFHDNNEDRFSFAANSVDILANPDEVWSAKNKKGVLAATYIKYYADCPIAVVVEDNQVKTVFKYLDKKGEINADSLDQDRQGTLLFRK